MVSKKFAAGPGRLFRQWRTAAGATVDPSVQMHATTIGATPVKIVIRRKHKTNLAEINVVLIVPDACSKWT
jgi:hypothetical protein